MNLKQAEELIKIKDWIEISQTPGLPERFIEKHLDKLSLHSLSMYQELSESFIEKCADEVDWDYISRYQKLSEKFIIKHESLLNIPYIFHNEKVKKGIVIYKDGEYFLAKKGKTLVPLRAICPVCNNSHISKKRIIKCSKCQSVFMK